MIVFRLHYTVQNNGDGSASTVFHDSEKEAEVADAAEEEGFAESTVGEVVLKVESGDIYRRFYNPEKHDYDWKKLEPSLF